jgi:hypothetical protein
MSPKKLQYIFAFMLIWVRQSGVYAELHFQEIEPFVFIYFPLAAHSREIFTDYTILDIYKM